jgi:hypothetical protein
MYSPKAKSCRSSSLVPLLIGFVLVRNSSPQQPLPDAPSATKAANALRARPSASGWPRTFASGTDTFIIYQPQVDRWEGNIVDLYSAVELRRGKGGAAKYGVVGLQARTEVDKVNRLVTLDQARVTKVKFPVAVEKEFELTALLQKKLPATTKTISLDRLEAAVDVDNETIKRISVKNDPPKVIISTKPSLLVLIDGMPQIRDVPGTKLQRVINTRSSILFDNDRKVYYLRAADWWLQSSELEGPWKYVENLSEDMKKAEELLISQKLVQNQGGEQSSQQPSLKQAARKRRSRSCTLRLGRQS